MASPTLIYCADGNKRYAQIAIDAGFKYGAQLPAQSLHFPIYFSDQDWKKPDRERYIAELAELRPYMATVLDWERYEQLKEVLGWAEDAAQFAQVVVIIPKVHHKVSLLPSHIAGKQIRLGYSVPTAYGGTELMINEFFGWPVHLLGGSPGKQKELTQYLDVRSVDGNMHLKMANSRGLFWLRGKGPFSNCWTSIQKADGERWKGDANYEAFRRSCENIRKYWRGK